MADEAPDVPSTTEQDTTAQDNIARGLAVAGMICFWCCVGATVYELRRRKRKNYVDAAAHAETAVIV